MPLTCGRFSSRRSLLIALTSLAMIASCELSSGFLSDSERSSLYSLSVGRSDGSAFVEGSVLLPGTEVAAFVSKKSGAADLATLDFSLASEGGIASSGLRLLSSSSRSLLNTGSGAGSAKSVPILLGTISGFQIPDTTPPGLYVLSVSISGPDGSVVQKDSVKVFVGRKLPRIAAVTTFPP